MIYREVIRYRRAYSRMLGSVLNPIIWLIFFGIGWASLFRDNIFRQIFLGLDYITFLAPGIVMMAIFSASFLGGVSMLWDREFGFLKEILVAPSSRSASLIGKSIGIAFTALVQGILILMVTLPLTNNVNLYGILPAIIVSYIVSLGFTSLGMAIASRMNSMEGFHLIVSVVMMPIIFLSGAFYPINGLPDWMTILIYGNPLTYGVDLVRYLLTGVYAVDPMLSLIGTILFTTVFTALSAYLFEKTTI
ncbi:MAG TPA: ABC transporter [Thermoprotei archaeon]|nr:ABC transporter [Thermoprotei archaeon]